MKHIPQIEFRRNPSNPGGIEVWDLQQFFAKALPDDHDPFLPHRLNFFVILIITSGHIKHTVDFQVHELTTGEALIIAKGQVHAFDKARPYHGTMVIFTDQYLHKHLSPATIDHVHVLFNYFVAEMKYTQQQLNRTFSTSFLEEYKAADPPLRGHVLGALLTLYLVKLEPFVPQSHLQKNRLLDHFLAFKALVEKGYAKTHDAKDYAEQLDITYKHLNKACKTITGKTAKVFIDDYVLLESKRQLVSTSLSSKEIAYKCGFHEPGHFLKFFKKHLGQSPRDFREAQL